MGIDLRRVLGGVAMLAFETMVFAAIAPGAGLWLVNVYVIAPFAGWDWFARRLAPIVQLVAHALVFAPAVAVYLSRVDSGVGRAAVETAEPAITRRAA